MKITYMKLRTGRWGLRVSVAQGETVSQGESVTVTLKSGETKTAVVGRILWSGQQEDGSTLAFCEIGAADRPALTRIG